jgi:hypothetical protein
LHGLASHNPVEHQPCKSPSMTTRIALSFEIDLPDPLPGDGARRTADRRAQALAGHLIASVLPRLAAKAGIEPHRLAGNLMVELGYVVGQSHAPVAAVDALAVAVERMRDALAGKCEEERRPVLPAPTVPAPNSLQ